MSLAGLQMFCKWHHGNRRVEMHISKYVTQEQQSTQEHILLHIWLESFS